MIARGLWRASLVPAGASCSSEAVAEGVALALRAEGFGTEVVRIEDAAGVRWQVWRTPRASDDDA